MADEPTTVVSTPTESPTPAPAGQSGASAEPKNSEETKPTGTPQAGQTPKDSAPAKVEETAPKGEPKKPVNLYELPEFRNVQSSWNKQLEEERQRRLQLEQKFEQDQVAKMNDFQKERYFRQKAEQTAQQLQDQLALMELREAKNRDIKQLSELTGAPMDVFEGAESLVEANMRGMAWLRENTDKVVKEKVKAALESREANKPDTGGGATPAPVSRREEALANAKSATDYVLALQMPEDD